MDKKAALAACFPGESQCIAVFFRSQRNVNKLPLRLSLALVSILTRFSG